MAKKQWELWYANFPFEDKNISKDRPIIVLSVQPLCVLSIKVTSHEVREADKYDVPITHWQEAGLKHESVARISKTVSLDNSKFRRKIGELHKDDIDIILENYVQFLLESDQVKMENGKGDNELLNAANE